MGGISGYTTTYNCIEMGYPFIECIESLFGFCDEVIVVDAGSTDKTLEALNLLRKKESRVKVFVEPVDFSHPRWAIHMDGCLKASSRAKCTGEFCWQTDSDEIVPPEDYYKIKTLPLLMQQYSKHSILFLPMVEFWGSLKPGNSKCA